MPWNRYYEIYCWSSVCNKVRFTEVCKLVDVYFNLMQAMELIKLHTKLFIYLLTYLTYLNYLLSLLHLLILLT